jgi:glycosyltransferase involved in cell wall biosynthesis
MIKTRITDSQTDPVSSVMSRSVSIIINNFNYDSFLEEAVLSALRQTHANCQVIVVDDGSTDKSREILAGYKDRILVLCQENGGQAAAFNTGFKHASGDLILFLDSDDLLHPDAIAELVSLWDESYTKIQFPLAIIDGKGEAKNLCMPSNRLSEGNAIESLLNVGRYVTAPTSGNLFSRRFLEEVMPMPVLNWRQGADSYLNTLAGFAGTVGVVHRQLGSYRVHGENMTGTVFKQRINLKQIEKLLSHGQRQQELVNAVADTKGLPVNRRGLEQHWLQLKLTLTYQKLALNGGRYKGESLATTCFRLVKSALSDKEVNLNRKVQISLWAIASTCLPKSWAEQVLVYGFEAAPVSKFKMFLRRSWDNNEVQQQALPRKGNG